MRPRYRRFLAAALAALVVWLGLSAIVTWRLTHRLAPVRSEPLPVVEWGKLEALRLSTDDGETLGAWLVRRDDSIGSALVLHGLQGSRSSTQRLIRQLHAARLNVLAITLRAHGDSTGESLDFGYGSRFDVRCGVDRLTQEFPEQPVFIFGQSLGAAAVLYASDDLDRRVAGVLLEHPYRDLKSAVWQRLQMRLPPGFDYLAYGGMRVWATAMLPISIDRLAPVDYADRFRADLPVVLMNGAQDRHAPLAETCEIGERIPRLLRLIVVRDAGHVTLSSASPTDYLQGVALLLETAAMGENVREKALRAIER